MAEGVIPIGEAREMARRHDCPVVVIFAIEPGNERFTVTTYGMTKKLCRHAADLGRQFSEAIMDQRVGPSETEPLDLPEEPAVLRRGPAGADVEARSPAVQGAIDRLHRNIERRDTEHVEALVKAARRVEEMDHDSDELAIVFKRETGYAAPWTEDPLLDTDDEELHARNELYNKWNRERMDDLRAALRPFAGGTA